MGHPLIAAMGAGALAKIAGAAALVLMVAAGVQTYRLASEQRDHAETRRAHAETIGKLERAARVAVEAARTEETRRYAALQEIARETEQSLDLARADAAAAATAGERLRQRVAEVTAACRRPAGDPGSTDAGPAADTTARVLADVQRRLDEATDRIARQADEARAAGLACERAYGALTSAR